MSAGCHRQDERTSQGRPSTVGHRWPFCQVSDHWICLWGAYKVGEGAECGPSSGRWVDLGMTNTADSSLGAQGAEWTSGKEEKVGNVVLGGGRAGT